MYPWILNDLADPQKWLQMTSPAAKINVSVHETSDAMSAVHFRWRWGGKIAKHITSVFRNVRPVYRPPDPLVNLGTKSEPGIGMSNKHNLGRPTQSVVPPIPIQNKREKGKWRAATEPSKPIKVTTNPKASKATRSKSIENWPQSSRGGVSTSRIRSQTSVPKLNRGSDVNHLGREISPSTSKSGSEKRSRFGLFLNWRPTKFQSNVISPSTYEELQVTQTFEAVAGVNPTLRRSEEALRYLRYTQSSPEDESGKLTAARRASSWGQGDKELNEVVSVTSIERELNDHDMNVGAGGVSRDGEFGIAVAGSSSLPLFDSMLVPAKVEETFDDVNERYGQPFFDEDSSTLASGPGDEDEWQHGSEFEDHDDDDDDDDNGDDGDESDQENGVTFSPRRRPLSPDEIA